MATFLPKLIALCLLAVPATAAVAQNPRLPTEDAIRIKEFYSLATALQDKLWPGWSKVPAPLMLVTSDTEFLTHHAAPPKEMQMVEHDLYARPRQFPTGFQATFPAFGPPAVMVVGQPVNTASKRSTPWLFMVMHEHFHQLQWAQPGYMDAINGLGLSRGDTTGMWMLNYPFPYENPEVVKSFHALRDLLLIVLEEKDEVAFKKLANQYLEQRKKFFALLSADDHKYFSFQLWQEGIARYTEVKAAELAADYHPATEFAALTDYESFASYAAKARPNTLSELREANLTSWRRTVVYSFGAAEGFFLDRVNPGWKGRYFAATLSADAYFELKN
ncbi:MAG TPA: hypothetical protein VMH04_21470 [Candidatus Solibacter sp.]|nr:hypothetical protein [Candidatus Solibacter sp.]